MPATPSRPLLLQISAAYAPLWLAALLLWRAGEIVPPWLPGAVLGLALLLGIAWLAALRRQGWPNKPATYAAGSAIFVAWWQLAVYLCDVGQWHAARSSLAQAGMFVLFVIGLGWVVWLLERYARRIEQARLDEQLANGVSLVGAPQRAKSAGRSWNPLDPAAWYYGRESRKLKQSTLVLLSYAASFWLAALLLSQMNGCREIYEMPAGGGQQKTVAQTVKIQKIIRKKFVVNPFSAIKFEVPPIDEVRLQLNEITEHAYTIGYGEGAGAGFAGGTKVGKVRLIRLEYDGGDWDLNYGVGGDLNMLIEYGILTQQKVAEQTESRRIAQLENFPAGKSPPVVFLTGQQNLSVSNGEVKALREYLIDKHGMLFASSGTRHFHNQFLSLMNRVLPEVRPVPIPLDDTIHRVPFAVPFLPYVVPHGGKDALGWSLDGRWIAYYHPGDISDAWADGHAGVSPEIYNSCYQLGANVINYGHTEYAKWLIAQQKKK